jgi:hypothetical protein
MYVWICDVPAGMKVPALLRRLQADIPPCRWTQSVADQSRSPQFVIDCPEE